MNTIKQAFTGLMISQHAERCKELCKQSYQELSPEDHEVIQSIMEKVPDVVSQFQKYGKYLKEQAKDIDVEDATDLMQAATSYLTKRETRETLHDMIAKYGPVLEKESNVRAIGAYVRCVISNVDERYKEAAVAALDLLSAVVGLVSNDPSVRNFAAHLRGNVQKNVVLPVATEAKNVAQNVRANNSAGMLRSNAATTANGSRKNTGNAPGSGAITGGATTRKSADKNKKAGKRGASGSKTSPRRHRSSASASPKKKRTSASASGSKATKSGGTATASGSRKTGQHELSRPFSTGRGGAKPYPKGSTSSSRK